MLVRNHKTKERAVIDFVKECYPDKSWVFDKTIEGSCSGVPDIVLEYGFGSIDCIVRLTGMPANV
jgi:hypothetical protein